MEEIIESKITTDEQKELFAATVVHDLKNPLNAQIAALEQLHKEKFGNLNVIQKEILNEIILSSNNMREMLSSLLSIYKFECGNVKLNKKLTDIDNMIRCSLKNFVYLSDEHCVFIEYKNSAHNYFLLCDENYIRRVLSNMMNNMILYSYKNTKALILLEEDNDNLKISFKSTGYPINNELKAHIFDKYAAGHHKKAGTGIGLYFCKTVIEAHNGTITLHTNNSDIEFSIIIPKEQTKETVLRFV